MAITNRPRARSLNWHERGTAVLRKFSPAMDAPSRASFIRASRIVPLQARRDLLDAAAMQF